MEGYLYVCPYVGDDVFVYPERVDVGNREELSRIHSEVWFNKKGLSLLKVLENLEGRRVRVVIERKRVTIEVLDSEPERT